MNLKINHIPPKTKPATIAPSPTPDRYVFLSNELCLSPEFFFDPEVAEGEELPVGVAEIAMTSALPGPLTLTLSPSNCTVQSPPALASAVA